MYPNDKENDKASRLFACIVVAIAWSTYGACDPQDVFDNPPQSWFVVHGDDPAVVSEYVAGREPHTVQVAEKIAEHYGLPTLNLAKAAAENGSGGVKSMESRRCIAHQELHVGNC